MRVLDGIRDILTRKGGVQMVADDPQMAAEILLLLRTMFVDGKMQPQELVLFKSLCKTVFHIDEKDVPEVIQYLTEVSYETSSDQAAALFRDMKEERKVELLKHLLMMAMADDVYNDHEREIISRVALALGYSEEEVRTLL